MALFDDLGNEITPIGGTEGNDNFTLVDSDITLNLLAGDDILVVTGSSNTINGGLGNDDLTDDGTGTGNILNGETGNDTLFGGTSGFLNGGSGRDLIYASPNGLGDNTISGGLGRDVFYIATAEIPTTPNTITDFNPSLDFITLSLAPDLTLFSDLLITTTDGDTTISFDDTDDAVENAKPIAILKSVTSDQLTAANVIILGEGQVTIPTLPNVAPNAPQGNLAVDHSPVVGETIGTVIATDPDEDEIASYAITGGTGVDLFKIDAAGVVTIKDEAAVTVLEANPDTTYTLTITATDTLGLTSVAGDFEVPQLENRPPVVNDGLVLRYDTTPAVGETLYPADLVLATDPDNDPLTYTFAADGNPNGLFAIALDGVVTIASTDGLTSPQTIAIIASDGLATDDGPITIKQNVAPTVDANQTFSYDSTPAAGEILGTVAITDPDDSTGFTYTITGGTGLVFNINENGQIFIDGNPLTPEADALTPGQLASLTPTATFKLDIEVTDPVGDTGTGTVDITGTSTFNLDIDGNGEYEALRDGLLVIRYLLTGTLTPLAIDGAFDPGGTRNNLDALNAYLGGNLASLDIDGNNEQEALRDGLLTIRYLLTGSLTPLAIDGAFDPEGTRNNLGALNGYLDSLTPELA